MLTELYIENIAIIKKEVINFCSGLTIFTGETGAGKSIVIDAIGLILGKRGSKDIIRTGQKSSFVSALFKDISMEAIKRLSLLGFSLDEEQKLLISREFFADAKNVCRINGKPCTVSMLKELSIYLISIHGQHDTNMIFNSDTQLYLIDKFAGNEKLIKEYKNEYDKYNKIKRELESFNIDENMKLRQIDILEFQIKEIEQLDLKCGEEEELLSRKEIINNSKKISDSMSQAYGLINGDEDNDGILSMLMKLSQCLKIYDDIDNKVQNEKIVKNMIYELQDISDNVSQMISSVDEEERDINLIESRLDKIYKVKRKYGETYDMIMDTYENMKKQFDDIRFADERKIDLEIKLKTQFQNTYEIAKEISVKRQIASIDFVKQVETYLKHLDMQNVKIKIDITDITINRTGKDMLEFFIETNLGSGFKPLAKIASGGELSRIMLAIKNVLADNDFIDTLIFDEIDTGVSGNTAYNIGKQLKKISQKKQVLCVTHSAQIASMADLHLFIKKLSDSNETFTKIDELDYQSRKHELARIIGGAQVTNFVLKSAEEMLNLANADI